MVAMVAANNAAFFAVLFLETTFVDLFVVCNDRIRRNHIVSALFFFFFFFFFARASFAYACSKEGGVFQTSETLSRLAREGIRDQKIFPIRSNPIGYFFLSCALNFLRAKKKQNLALLSLSLSVFREFNEYSAIFTLKAGAILRRGKGRIRLTRTEERDT